MPRFGVHVGLQHTHPDELRAVWRRIEDLGFHWISVWDHFYGATGEPDDAECLEAVAMHAALAVETSRVEVGCLVYSVGYRHPAVLAKAITTIDLLSGGRAAIGLGGGWAEVEYRAYGIPYPGIFVLDHTGVIRAKLAEEDYRIRPDFSLVLEAASALP